ncbi:MAG: hypothetical protein AAGG51_10310 [Cyanobacteria bacterium P01_G01_bin.54]
MFKGALGVLGVLNAALILGSNPFPLAASEFEDHGVYPQSTSVSGDHTDSFELAEVEMFTISVTVILPPYAKVEDHSVLTICLTGSPTNLRHCERADLHNRRRRLIIGHEMQIPINELELSRLFSDYGMTAVLNNGWEPSDDEWIRVGDYFNIQVVGFNEEEYSFDPPHALVFIPIEHYDPEGRNSPPGPDGIRLPEYLGYPPKVI